MKKSRQKKKAVNFLSHHFSKLAFLFSLALGFLLIPPAVWKDQAPLASLFLLVFGLTMTCTIRSIKDGVKAAGGSGILNIFSSLVGLVALEVCSTSFFCGAASIGIISVVLPALVVNFLSEHAIHLVWISVLVQLASLWRMGCLRNGRILRILADG